MNKKILILNWRCPKNPLSGGAEKVTLEHAKAWVKGGYRVTWLAGGFLNSEDEEIIEGVTVVRWGNPITVYCYAPLYYWFNKGKFDLVIDEFHGLPYLTPLWAWKSKKLAYIHEVAQEIWDEMLPFPVNILGKLYEKFYFFFYKTTPFLTGSNSTKDDLVRYGIPDNNITVLPHGLFIKPVDAVPKKERELTLIFVGRLVKMKGIEDAIRIFAEVKKNDTHAQFWIVGNGDKKYVNKLSTIIKELELSDSITLFGFVDETKKIDLLQRAHFLVHTSVREGFGLTVIEASSQGTPVLAYNVPGLKDIIKSGVNGFLFNRGDLKQIAKKCISVYNDPNNGSLSQSAITESRRYKWEHITKQGLHLLQKILSSR